MLLERDEELGLLRTLLVGTATHGGKVVLIRGEAGIGKSSLVRSFLASVAGSAHVQVGFCDDFETPQPYGPLWDMARDHRALSEALQSSDRQRVMQAFFDLLATSLRPNVVVIEDTQWSDEATLDAIKYVGRRIARTNGVLILTYRDEEVDLDNPLRGVLGDLTPETVERIDLSGLSKTAVTEIVAEAGLDPDTVLKLTRGNPFLVTEMALVADDTVPASVRDSVMARVGRLSLLSREMMRYLSVIPERTPRDELEALMGAAESQLAECERLGLLEVDGETVAFRHDLIRRAVESSLTSTEKTEINRQLLALLPEDTNPSRLVHHAIGANDVARLIEVAPQAARAAADVGAHREASAHYRAVEPHLARLPDEKRAQLLVDWALMEYYLAHEESVEILERAIDLNRSRGDRLALAKALTLAITVHETHGFASAARQHADEAIQLLRAADEPYYLAEALSRFAYLLIHIGEGRLADRATEEALELATATGNELARIRALSVKGQLAVVRGQPGGLSLAEQARNEAEHGGYRFEEAKTLRNLAYIALEISDLTMEEDLARRARDTAIRYELPILEAEAKTVYVDALMRRGDWSAAEELATETLGSHANADLHLKRVLGLLRLRTGRPGASEYLADSWSIAVRYDEIDFLLHVGAGLAEQMWLHDDADQELANLLIDLVERGIHQEFPWPSGWLAFWLWRMNLIDEAPAGVSKPHALVMAGDVAEAASIWKSRRMPYRLATVLGCGATSERLQSLEMLDKLGADAVSAKARRDLRNEGITVPRGRSRATRGHAGGLTARQAEILELLARNLTNSEIADRLFLSPRTVENHVSAVLAKLDSSTREQAVETARKRSLI